jgi:hypothetical protein
MRCPLFAFFLGAVLFAQEPPAPQAPAPRTVVVPAQPAYPAPGKTLSDQQQSLRKRLMDLLKQRAASAPEETKFALAPGQPCSIPLKEVLPQDADKADPKIVMPAPAGGLVLGFIRHVNPPAPPCEAVKR